MTSIAYQVDDEVLVRLSKGRNRTEKIGIIRWAGELPNQNGIWYNIELRNRKTHKIYARDGKILIQASNILQILTSNQSNNNNSQNTNFPIVNTPAIDRRQRLKYMRENEKLQKNISNELIRIHLYGIAKKPQKTSNEYKTEMEIDDYFDKDTQMPKSLLYLNIHRGRYKVSSLMNEIYEQFNISTKCRLIIVYNNVMLSKVDETFFSYGILHNSCLLVCVSEDMSLQKSKKGLRNPYRNPRNSNRKIFENVRKCQLFKMAFIEDIDIFAYERNSKCIQMECGHGMTKDTLYDYTLSQLNNACTSIRCPHLLESAGTKLCRKIWNFGVICKILMPPIKKPKTDKNIGKRTNHVKYWQKSIEAILVCGFIRDSMKNFDYSTAAYSTIQRFNGNFNFLSCLVFCFFSLRKLIPLQLKLECSKNNRRKKNKKSKKMPKVNMPIIVEQSVTTEIVNDLPRKTAKEIVEDVNKLAVICARNVFLKKYDIQQCPTCKTIVYRKPTNLAEIKCRTGCPVCLLSFCWACGWPDLRSADCSNVKCTLSFVHQTVKLLKECGTKTIGSVRGVPEVRACPKCSMLITHVSACKHINCRNCKESFCFVCLKNQKNGSWQCGGYSSACPIAKRQKMKDLKTHGLIVPLGK